MTATDDTTLLQKWAEARSEGAFRALVERYAPLVWGAALRRTGDHGMSEEAAQQVFADLARKAPVLVELNRPLAAWLHRSAVYEAVQVLRRELRHRERMKEYAALESGAPDAPDPWEDVRPHLDEAINSMSEPDRRVLFLHWYQRKSFTEAAVEMGCSPAAAQRRGLRALDKLATALRRRGAEASAAVLAAGLTTQLTPSVSAATLAGLTTAGTSAGGVSASALLTQKCFYAVASAKFATAAVFLVSAALPVGWQVATAHTEQVPTKTGGTKPAARADAAPPRRTSPAALDIALVQDAIARLLANADDYDTELALRRLMFSLTLEEIPGVQALLMAVANKKKEALYEVSHALFARWTELDGPAAVAAAADLPKSAFGFYPLRGAFITWAASDLDAAWTWLEKRTDTMDRNFLGGEALASHISYKEDGAAMIARADAVTDKAWREELRYWVVRAWLRAESNTEAIEWAAALSDEVERTEWLGKAVELAGEQYPPAGLANVHRIENADRRSEVTHNILWPWLLAEPDAAFAALERHAGDWNADHFRFAGDAMTRHDAARALAAAQRLGGPERDKFVSGMMTGALYSGEAAAVLPALKLIGEDRLMQDGSLTGFVEALTAENPRAAAEWLVSLPGDSMTRLRSEPQFKVQTGSTAAEWLNSSTR